MNAKKDDLSLIEYDGQEYLQQGETLRPVALGEAFDVHEAPGVAPFFSNGATNIRVRGSNVSPVSDTDVQKVVDHSAEFESMATRQRETDFQVAEARQAERLAKIAKLTTNANQ